MCVCVENDVFTFDDLDDAFQTKTNEYVTNKHEGG